MKNILKSLLILSLYIPLTVHCWPWSTKNTINGQVVESININSNNVNSHNVNSIFTTKKGKQGEGVIRYNSYNTVGHGQTIINGVLYKNGAPVKSDAQEITVTNIKPQATKNFTLKGDFKAISAPTGKVYLDYKKSSQEASLQAPKNIINLLDLKEESNTLSLIGKEDLIINNQTNNPLFTLHVGVKGKSNLKLLGSAQYKLQNFLNHHFPQFALKTHGNITLEGDINAKNLSIKSHGSSNVTINNKTSMEYTNLISYGSSDINIKAPSCNTMKINAQGSSSINADSFSTNEVKANASGAAEIKVNALLKLIGDASGASSIFARTKPSVHKVSKSGAASVKYGK